MKARLIEDQLYEITDGRKWYTANRRPDGSYFVMNHVGRVVNEGSDIHRRVVRAVEAVRGPERTPSGLDDFHPDTTHNPNPEEV